MRDSRGTRIGRNLFLTDLGLVSLLGVFMIAVGSGMFIEFPGRGLIGLIAVVFAPGYALVSALFPRHETGSRLFEQIQAGVPEQNVTTIERLLLSIGLSISLVPLVGIVLNYTVAGISSGAILVLTGLLTIITAGIATIRRAEVPATAQFAPDLFTVAKKTLMRAHAAWTGSRLSLLLVVGFIVVGASIGIAAIDTDRGEQFSAVYLLTEDPESGEYVADGYPETIQQGQTEDLRVGVSNHEDDAIEYTVIAELQAVDDNGDITDTQTIDEFAVDLDPGESWEETHSVSPEMTGEELRLTYLLYKEQPPDSDVHHPEDAYRSTHIWIAVN